VTAAWHSLPIRVKADLEPVTQAVKSQANAGLKGYGCFRKATMSYSSESKPSQI
jgi:hypothetical protein